MYRYRAGYEIPGIFRNRCSALDTSARHVAYNWLNKLFQPLVGNMHDTRVDRVA